MKKIIISGGGTGGHIFPALAIADEIRRRYPETEILFVGAEGRMEMERIPRAGYDIVGLPVRGFDRKGILNIFKTANVTADLLHSLMLANGIIRRFSPEIVVGVGGYASAPMLKVAQLMKIPTLIQEQNSYAGVTNKLLAKGAQRICVAYPEMERFFPADKIVVTGNPIRPAILQPLTDRAAALSYFGLHPDTEQILFVVGGSLGARTINQAISAGLKQIATNKIGLIWQTGKQFLETAKDQAAGTTGLNAHVTNFIDRMDLAYGLSSLVVSRSGACSVSELSLLGKPSILVPSPNVAEDHQTKNATALSSRSAALLITDAEAADKLVPTALQLIAQPNELAKLAQGALALAERDSAARIVDEVEKLVG